MSTLVLIFPLQRLWGYLPAELSFSISHKLNTCLFALVNNGFLQGEGAALNLSLSVPILHHPLSKLTNILKQVRLADFHVMSRRLTRNPCQGKRTQLFRPPSCLQKGSSYLIIAELDGSDLGSADSAEHFKTISGSVAPS